MIFKRIYLMQVNMLLNASMQKEMRQKRQVEFIK